MDKAGELLTYIWATTISRKGKVGAWQRLKKDNQYKVQCILALAVIIMGFLTLLFCLFRCFSGTVASFALFLAFSIIICLHTGDRHSNDLVEQLGDTVETAYGLLNSFAKTLQIRNFDMRTVEACIDSFCSQKENQRNRFLSRSFTVGICVGFSTGINLLFNSMGSIQCENSNPEMFIILANISIVIIVCSITFTAIAGMFWNYMDNRNDASLKNAKYFMFCLNMRRLSRHTGPKA